MNRHELREKAMITVYQYLLVERNIDELIEDTFEAPKAEIDPYFIEVIEQSISNIDRYQAYIDKVLVDWKFDRLGKIEQAILLNGCSEFDLKKTEAAVIIDESVQLAKKYCDADTYKLINSVLDVI
jgi:N utilization substance protein B